jgi:hypothetical protein
MPLQSDITINLAKFDPVTVPDKSIRFNDGLLAIDHNGPNWWEVRTQMFCKYPCESLTGLLGRSTKVSGNAYERRNTSTKANDPT